MQSRYNLEYSVVSPCYLQLKHSHPISQCRKQPPFLQCKRYLINYYILLRRIFCSWSSSIVVVCRHQSCNRYFDYASQEKSTIKNGSFTKICLPVVVFFWHNSNHLPQPQQYHSIANKRLPMYSSTLSATTIPLNCKPRRC